MGEEEAGQISFCTVSDISGARRGHGIYYVNQIISLEYLAYGPENPAVASCVNQTKMVMGGSFPKQSNVKVCSLLFSFDSAGQTLMVQPLSLGVYSISTLPGTQIG